MTLTERWEEEGRPRPPFLYLFDHPDKDKYRWRKVDLVEMTDEGTIFRDDGGKFDGSLIKVRWLTCNMCWSEADLQQMGKELTP